MRISVIVPYRNAARTLVRCVENLSAGTRAPDEIVLVDDASDDNGFDTIAHLPGLIHIRNIEPQGAATARNLGVAASTGDVLLFIDADVLPRPDVLEKVETALQDKPQLGGVFGAYTPRPEPENFATVYKNLVHHHTHLESAGRIGSFWAGCGALRREAFLTVGGFNDDYEAASVEDIDLGYRLAAKGIEVELRPAIQVTHIKRYTFASLIKSDVAARAIPWTKLMIRRRTFRTELNLKPHNLLAAVTAVVVPIIALVLILSGRAVWCIAPAAAGLMIWFVLNGRLFSFVAREKGRPFLLLFAPMFFLSHIYSAVGLLAGLAVAFLGSEKT